MGIVAATNPCKNKLKATKQIIFLELFIAIVCKSYK
jgi:hypothetical protein